MEKKTRCKALIIFGAIILLLIVGIILTGMSPPQEKEPITEAMRDAVLHEKNRVDLFGLSVNPGLIAAFCVTGMMFVFALLVRIFAVPRFTKIPGKFQLLLEQAVGLFDDLAKNNSPHRNRFLGAYVFAAGAYIFVSTIFEMFGFQVVTTAGRSVAMPAPLSDINGAIGMGLFTYLVILGGGIVGNRLKGVGNTLKDFSLPLSMSFRLFGALISGALVTELVYSSMSLSFGLPIFVGVLFTLLHAVIQAYVLTMLAAMFYGEVSEPSEKKPKQKKHTKQ